VQILPGLATTRNGRNVMNYVRRPAAGIEDLTLFKEALWCNREFWYRCSQLV